MADVKKVVEIEIDVETGDIRQLNKDLNKTAKNVNDVGKASKQSTKGIRGMAKSFKAVGVALKAAGIGLIIAVLAKLADLFSQNQKVMDAFSSTINGVSVVFNELFKALERVYNTVSFSSENFDALGKVLSGVLDLAIKPFQFAWYAIERGIILAQKAWEESVFGDGDTETIERLNKELDDNAAKMSELAAEAEKSAIDIYNNFSEAIDEVGGIATAVAEEVSKIDFKSAFDAGDEITRSRKQLQLLEIETRRLQLENQKQAEIQRQIRDDETKSFEERIAANERLGEILEESIRIEQDAVNQRIAILEREQQLLGATFERELEIKNLRVELLDIEERITGVQSEQLVNRNSLLREQADLEKQRRDELAEIFAEQEAMRDKEVEAAEARAKKLEEIERNHQEAKKDLTQDGLQAVADLTNAFAGQSEKAQKKAFLVNKALQIAQATIETYRSATAAYASQLSIPTPDAPIRAAAAAAIATAFGIAQVAQIARTKFEGRGSSTPSVSSPSSIGAGAGQAPQFNTVGASGTNQLAESIANQNQTPSRAYVVASDISTAQALDRNKIDTASFG